MASSVLWSLDIPDELFIEDQINDVYKDLSNAMKNPSHELFKNVPRARRMQKLDTELIKYFRDAKDDISTAARVAVRMLIEDEYVYPGAEEEAYKMLVIYLKTAEDKNCPADEDGLIAEELESVANALGAGCFPLSRRESKQAEIFKPQYKEHCHSD